MKSVSILATMLSLVGGAPFGQSLPPGVTLRSDLEYANVGDKALRLDLYYPKSSSPLPVVVWIHGGSWNSGSKAGSPAVRLTDRGYAVASINYRLSYEALFPAQIHDCKAAVRWLRAHSAEHNLDPDRIAAWGASAGGHLAALLGTSGGVSELEGNEGNLEYSSRVQAVVDWYGPADFLSLEYHAQAQGCTGNYFSPSTGSAQMLGCAIPACPGQARAASPTTYVSQDDPPFLIMHGTEDCTVPAGESQELRGALTQAGVSAALHWVEGAGHGGQAFETIEVAQTVDSFLDRQLGPGQLTLHFPHIAAGAGLSSCLTLVNRSVTRPAIARITSRDADGQPLALGLGGNQGNVQELSIPPLGKLDLATSLNSGCSSGSAHVLSNVPLAGIVRFSATGLGSTAVEQAAEVSGFVAPVSRHVSTGADTGVAVASTGKRITVHFALRDVSGSSLPGGEAVVELPAWGRISLLLAELFPQAGTQDFEGVLTATTSGGLMVAHVLRFGSQPGELVSLPVTALEP